MVAMLQVDERLTALEAENERLREFVQRVFDLSLAAQAGNALAVCGTIHGLARVIRETRMCPLTCTARHTPTQWASMLGKPRITIYRWMRRGLQFEESRGPVDSRRVISHAQMSTWLARNIDTESGGGF